MRKQVGSWRSAFLVFPLLAVTWDTNFVILGVQSISFDRPGASILLLGTIFVSWGHSRGPWKDTWGPRTRFSVILADFGTPF